MYTLKHSIRINKNICAFHISYKFNGSFYSYNLYALRQSAKPLYLRKIKMMIKGGVCLHNLRFQPVLINKNLDVQQELGLSKMYTYMSAAFVKSCFRTFF